MFGRYLLLIQVWNYLQTWNSKIIINRIINWSVVINNFEYILKFKIDLYFQIVFIT